MASFKQIPSGLWQGIVSYGSEGRRTKTFPTRAEAELWAAPLEAAKAERIAAARAARPPRQRRPDPHRPPSRALVRVVLPGEEWRSIPGWEGVYEVSNLGRVYRVKEAGFTRSGRILRTCVVDGGYFHVCLSRNAKPWKVSVQHLVMRAFVGPRPAGLVIRHLDGDPTNNRVENLRYGTYSENAYDKRRHGTDHNANKTHCKRGHPLSGANVYHQPSDGPVRRRCRICKAAITREWEARARARRAA